MIRKIILSGVLLLSLNCQLEALHGSASFSLFQNSFKGNHEVSLDPGPLLPFKMPKLKDGLIFNRESDGKSEDVKGEDVKLEDLIPPPVRRLLQYPDGDISKYFEKDDTEMPREQIQSFKNLLEKDHRENFTINRDISKYFEKDDTEMPREQIQSFKNLLEKDHRENFTINREYAAEERKKEKQHHKARRPHSIIHEGEYAAEERKKEKQHHKARRPHSIIHEGGDVIELRGDLPEELPPVFEGNYKPSREGERKPIISDPNDSSGTEYRKENLLDVISSQKRRIYDEFSKKVNDVKSMVEGMFVDRIPRF